MHWIKYMLLIGSICLLYTPHAGDKFDMSQHDQINLALSASGAHNAEIDVDSKPLPLTKRIPVLIEGMEERLVLKLHEAKSLGFYTYVPQDMEAKSSATAFTVHSRFQGKLNPAVKIEITKLSLSSIKEADRQFQRHLQADGFAVSPPDNRRFGFASYEYTLKRGELIGRGAVFEYNNQPYTIVYHYPPEYGDGVEPRLEIILDELVWYESQYK